MSTVTKAPDRAHSHYLTNKRPLNPELTHIESHFYALKFTSMKTDEKIQQDVIEQIKWNPLLNATEIGVAVKNGVVTLSGQVDSYHKKLEAEKEAKKVSGVKAIAEDIHVGISASNKRTDTEIAEAVINALKWHTSISQENIQVKVEEGFVTLDGEVEWDFQRESAKNAVVSLAGVRSVINTIRLKQKVTPDDLKQKINAAFHRSASLDASKIEIEVVGTRAILKGKVRSFAEREDAESAAWSAPGILDVDNKLELVEMEDAAHYSF
jgi:osmotically-inducible protein OsmY